MFATGGTYIVELVHLQRRNEDQSCMAHKECFATVGM